MFVAIARLLGNLIRLPLLPLWWLTRLISRPRGQWLLVRVRPRVVELERPHPFFLRFFPTVAKTLPTALSSLRRLADHAVRDHRVTGVVFEIPPLVAGWATCASLRNVITKLRAGGKTVVAYLPQGGGNREIYVASAAGRVLVGPQATVMALGLSIEARYIKPLLHKIGLDVHATARGEYKTAAESVTRESMSDQQREQLSALLAAMDRELVSSIAAMPGMDEQRARAAFERGFLRGEDAVEAGLAEATCYEDELPVKLAVDGGKPVGLIRAPRYLAFKDARWFKRIVPQPYVAVIEVHGPIMQQAPGSMGRGGADPDQLATVLRAARSDRFAVGVVLHVSSPGGSALASDLIHREVVRLREKKPVIACFGDVAASGGYYVAAAANAIVAQPVTLTGSIGVVMARVVARELFDKLGVRTETIKTAPHADLFSPSRELTGDEQAILDREADGFYSTFVGLVAEGRGRPREEIEPLARGRVWSGADAKERGLVDELGGLDTAIELCKERASVPERVRRRVGARTVRLRRFEPPPPEPPAAAAGAAMLLGGLGPEALELLSLLGTGDRALFWAVPPRVY